MNLQNYTIKELVELKNLIDAKINSYEDGFLYICRVRSYGRNWTVPIYNEHTLEELCHQYSGDDGVVDVYSTNPDLQRISNYGDLMYIQSQEDFDRWKAFRSLVEMIPNLEREWEEWDNRENIPFRERRSYFAPMYSKEDIEELKVQMKELEGTFIEPKSYRTETEII